MQYVIYCRKSSDESSDNQKQSIPDQIQACMKYAEKEWLKIKEKPKDFSLFESESEINKEKNEPNISNRRIYSDTNKYFIIKEQETWKIPWKRKKWRTLIKMIKQWKIEWLLSYSPDRQARNMLEWGELIDYVDNHLVTLKYTNFHFENNASWKMMLGIWFVFSKQYSDKLSEDITRGNDSKVSSGRSVWRYKPWYQTNDDGYHEPHPKNFELIKEAFEMKLNWVIESKIRDFLNANGYVRKMKKSGKESNISKNSLNKIFRDEFYYGIFINWKSIVDLRETNKYYKPLITEEQFQILQDRYNKNPTVIARHRTKDIYEDLKAFHNSFIISKDNFHFTFSLPNKKRFEGKIEKQNKLGKKIWLSDVVASHQIFYECKNKASDQK